MSTKFTKFGIEVEIIKREDGKCTIRIDFGEHDITFQDSFYSEGEALSYASDFLDDLKSRFKPYIITELEKLKDKDQTEFFN